MVGGASLQKQSYYWSGLEMGLSFGSLSFEGGDKQIGFVLQIQKITLVNYKVK